MLGLFITKKIKHGAAIVFGFAAFTVSADMLGFKAGAEYWQADPTVRIGDTGFSQDLNLSDEANAGFYFRFEHPVPLLPNISARYGRHDFSGQTKLAGNFRLDNALFPKDTTLSNDMWFRYTDLSAYYELLDNDIVSLDFGVTLRLLQAGASVQAAQGSAYHTFSTPVPMVYLDGQIGVFGTSSSVFFNGNYTRYADSRLNDARLGLAFELFESAVFDLGFKIGVQQWRLNIADQDDMDADLQLKGVFAALEAGF